MIDEPDAGAYHFVSHYQVRIAAPEAVVWEHLLDLKSWMYEFELATVAGDKGKVGEVLRLYENQDFLIQRVMEVPNETLVIANLPSTFRGEDSTGSSVMSLQQREGATIVDLTMSRRYVWTGDGVNEQRKIRASETFVRNTDAMWQDRFLDRLRCLAERNCEAQQ